MNISVFIYISNVNACSHTHRSFCIKYTIWIHYCPSANTFFCFLLPQHRQCLQIADTDSNYVSLFINIYYNS